MSRAAAPEPSARPDPRPLPAGEQTLYRRADGEPVLVVVRHDEPGGKRFTQWTPAPVVEGLCWPRDRGGREPWPLLNVAALLRHRALLTSHARRAAAVIVEGEKCWQSAVDRPKEVRLALGLELAVPVTFPGGATNWPSADWEPLRGCDLVLLADADETGRCEWRRLAALLSHELRCRSRVVIPPPDDPTLAGTDLADWLSDTWRGPPLHEIVAAHEEPTRQHHPGGRQERRWRRLARQEHAAPKHLR